MKKSLIALVLGSGIFGGVLADAKPAAAWWTRQFGGVIYSVKNGDRLYPGAADYPILSTSSMSMAAAKTIWVETYNLRSDAVTSVQICAAYWASNGEACSPRQEQSGSGHKSYGFGTYAYIWDEEADFPYYTVQSSTRNSAGGAVRVNGIFITN